MAATLRDLELQLMSGREHHGFGQEPVPDETDPKNTALALFVAAHLRAPKNQAELDAFMEDRSKFVDELIDQCRTTPLQF